MSDPRALAEQLRDAYAQRVLVPSPTSLDPAFDVAAGYAVERELVRLRAASGHHPVGVKVGFANKAMWRVLKLDTLVWAHMYDDTVRLTGDGSPSLTYSVAPHTAPKIEPEIVFKLKQPIPPGGDAAAALACVEWLALGFEIIDCVYPEWKFQAPDFIAGYGLHAGLVVGQPRMVTQAGGEGLDIAGLVDALPRFTVKLARNGEVVAEGSGKNSLRSPAACLAELATAVAARGDSDSLGAGALVSSGTLTDSQPMAAGETWTATVDGIDLAPISLTVVAN